MMHGFNREDFDAEIYRDYSGHRVAVQLSLSQEEIGALGRAVSLLATVALRGGEDAVLSAKDRLVLPGLLAAITVAGDDYSGVENANAAFRRYNNGEAALPPEAYESLAGAIAVARFVFGGAPTQS